MAYQNIQPSDLYLLYVSSVSNLPDPFESKIDGDVTAFQIPYSLQLDSILALVHGELGTDAKNSQVFYLDDESDYVQISTQDEFEIALNICRKSRNVLHFVITGSKGEKRKIPDEETVSAASYDLDKCDDKEKVKDSDEKAKEQNKPLEKEAVDTVNTELPDQEQLADVLSQEHIRNLIKEEVSHQVELRMRDYVSKISSTNTQEQIQQCKSLESFSELNDKSPNESVDEQRIICNAVLICENLLQQTTYKPNIKLQKYWVFRNEGNVPWDEHTKLVLLSETYCVKDKTYFKGERHEWGAGVTTVPMPCLKEGESGVVEAIHTTPIFKCCYTSTWVLCQDGIQFGPQVHCKLFVSDDVGSPVDTNVSEQQTAIDDANSNVKSKSGENSFSEKPKVSPSPSHTAPALTDDIANMLSFNMSDISSVTRHISTEVPEQQFDLLQNKNDGSLTHVSHQSSNVDGEIISMEKVPSVKEETLPVDPKELEVKQEEYFQEQMVEEVKQYEEEEEESISTPEHVVEAFEDESSENEADPDAQKKMENEGTDSDDGLQSVDYINQHENDFKSTDVSDFVVILPECFDITQPLSNGKKESSIKSESKDTEEPKSLETMSSTVSSVKTATEVLSNYKSPSLISSLQSGEDKLVSKEQDPVSTPSSIHNQEEIVQSQEALSLGDMEVASSTSEDDVEEENISLQEISPKEDSHISRSLLSNKPTTPPQSVLDIDKPYDLPEQATVQVPFEEGYKVPPIPLPRTVLDDNVEMKSVQIPFEQGWRRNPSPLPKSVINEDANSSTESEPNPSDEEEDQLVKEEQEDDETPSGQVAEVAEQLANVTVSEETTTTANTSNPLYSESVDRAVERNLSELMGVPQALLNTNDEEEENMEADEDAEFTTPPPSPQESLPPEYPISSLDRIYEMGFHNIELNEMMLNNCDGDVNRAVQALVLRSMADENIVPLDDDY